jgi:hypothetical protein
MVARFSSGSRETARLVAATSKNTSASESSYEVEPDQPFAADRYS